MSKYMYLPDKNGNITRCGARDHSKCPYHLGKDGKPLKHYATPEEARKAFEDTQAMKNNVRKLSKKTSPKHIKFIPGPYGPDERFIPSKYRGLSMDELDKKLDRNIGIEKRERERLESLGTDLVEKLNQKAKDLSLDLDYDPVDYSEHKPSMPIEDINRNILDYKRKVFDVLSNLQREADKCDSDGEYSRKLLRKLELAHPGADYGSEEKDDETVCANAKAYLEAHLERINYDCPEIGPIHGEENYEEDRGLLLSYEKEINGILDDMRGVTGPEDRMIIDGIGDENDDTDSGRQNYMEIVRKHHPEYARLENQLNGVEARLLMVGRREDEDSYFKKNIGHLKTMKPISGSESKQALKTVISKSYPDYGKILKKKGKAIAASNTGDILIEVPNDDGFMEYEIHDKHGRPTDTYQVINYDEGYANKFGRGVLEL